ncbi:MAG: hypothetical protein H0W82_07605 [Actinobacteria bacterium]|nr:hypothetical protein [Actinomycetota bacterium]
MNRKDISFRPLRQVVYSVRSFASTSPTIYLPFARRKYLEVPDRVVETGTELVIEGFQRSGNTFSVIAFEVAQPRHVKTAHHLHAAAQVVEAVRLGVPTIVLIRDPRGSVLSHMVREPGVTASQALGAWVRFYERVLPLRDRVVIADFGEVTTDLGKVIARVNERYGTGFAEFDHTPGNVARVFALIEDRNRARYGSVSETTVPRPSAERDERKRALLTQLDADRLAPLRLRAATVYRALVPSATVT